MILDVTLPPLQHESNIDRIIYRTCNKHGMQLNEVLSDSRKKETVFVRHKIVKKARQSGMTYKEIAKALGRDHSSIIHLDKHYTPFNSLS